MISLLQCHMLWSASDPGGSGGGAAPAEQLDTRLVAANTQFSIALLQALARNNPNRNIFVSPAGIGLALAMAYNGASGETQTAMAETLFVPNLALAELNHANAALLQVLEHPDPEAELAVANSLWVRQDVALIAAFADRIQALYRADVAQLNFNDPGAPDQINAWVRQHTRDRINSIIQDIPPDALLLLINAIAFKGKWSDPFEPAQTRDGAWALTYGRTKQTPLMRRSGTYRYLRGDTFQALALPYGSGRVAMYVFLPDPDTMLAGFLAQLDPQRWAAWMQQFRATEVDVRLPRFELEYDVLLNAVLGAMGMAVAFDPVRADFSGMVTPPPPAFIGAVQHKAFVQVNEEGTEAVAVTAIMMAPASYIPLQPFHVDRPFVFAIRDEQNGALLFMGVIVDPHAPRS